MRTKPGTSLLLIVLLFHSSILSFCFGWPSDSYIATAFTFDYILAYRYGKFYHLSMSAANLAETRTSPRLSDDSSTSSSFQFIPKMEDYEGTDIEPTIYTPCGTIASESGLPTRSKTSTVGDQFQIELHPLPEKDGILVSVIPPKQPKSKINHVPCDIVLVIDVSGSMGCDAPVPTTSPSERERNGLSVLDLVKHAARTIIETLDENDRLGLVTFSTEARVVQNLLPMTKKNKKEAWALVGKLQVESMTNLWHGILNGIKLFDDDERKNTAAAVMILTDGMPNHM